MLSRRCFWILAAMVVQISAVSTAIPTAFAQSVVQTPQVRPPQRARSAFVPKAPPRVDSSAEQTPWALQVWHFVANLFQVPAGQPAFRDPFKSADRNHPWRSSTQ